MVKKLLSKIWKPKCKHTLIDIYEKPIERTFVWTTSRYVRASNAFDGLIEQTVQNTFTGIAFLKYEFCPLCCKGFVSLCYPDGYIPYKTEYLLDMVSQHMKEDGIHKDKLGLVIIMKCLESGFSWNGEAFQNQGVK